MATPASLDFCKCCVWHATQKRMQEIQCKICLPHLSGASSDGRGCTCGPHALRKCFRQCRPTTSTCNISHDKWNRACLGDCSRLANGEPGSNSSRLLMAFFNGDGGPQGQFAASGGDQDNQFIAPEWPIKV